MLTLYVASAISLSFFGGLGLGILLGRQDEKKFNRL